jgi:hypothetical protein
MVSVDEDFRNVILSTSTLRCGKPTAPCDALSAKPRRCQHDDRRVVFESVLGTGGDRVLERSNGLGRCRSGGLSDGVADAVEPEVLAAVGASFEDAVGDE